MQPKVSYGMAWVKHNRYSYLALEAYRLGFRLIETDLPSLFSFYLRNLLQDEVRKLAAKMDLPNKDRKDSQGICFLGKVKLLYLINIVALFINRGKDNLPKEL